MSFENFFTWAIDNGAIFQDNLQLKHNSESNRCFTAKKDFQEKDVLIFLPEKMLLTESQLQKNPLIKGILEKQILDQI